MMNLVADLHGSFVKASSQGCATKVDNIVAADGLIMNCPVCYERGAEPHLVAVWSVATPKDIEVGPRWLISGRNLLDVSVGGGTGQFLTVPCDEGVAITVENGTVRISRAV